MPEYSEYDDFEDDEYFEHPESDWDFSDDDVVTINVVETEPCPVCGCSRSMQNYLDRYLFLCLACFHEFRNS